MPSELQVSTDFPHTSFQTDLNGVTFGLTFRWNERAEAWFMDLSDAEGVSLLAGVRVVVGFPLAKRSSDPRMPAGTVWAFDTTGGEADPGRSDLGARVKLIFFEEVT